MRKEKEENRFLLGCFLGCASDFTEFLHSHLVFFEDSFATTLLKNINAPVYLEHIYKLAYLLRGNLTMIISYYSVSTFSCRRQGIKPFHATSPPKKIILAQIRNLSTTNIVLLWSGE